MLRRLLAAAALAAPALVHAAGAPAASRAEAYYSYSLARQAWSRQDYAEALRQMQAAVAADPDAADLALDLARLHFDLGQPEEAAAAAHRAAELRPDSAPARRVLGDALLALVQREGSAAELTEQAIDAYREAVRLDPSDAEAHLNLARLLISRGAYPQALEALRRHLELDRASEDGVYLAAHVLARLERYEEAESLLREAIGARPRDPGLRLALMDVCEAAGRLDEAATVGRAMLDADLEPVRAHFALARLSQRRGRHEEAYRHLEAAAGLMAEQPTVYSDGDQAEIQVRMVQALLDAGRVSDALALSQSAGKRFQGDIRFVLREGEALLLQGRTDRAEALFRQKLPGGSVDARRAAQVSDTYLSAAARRERAGRITEAEEHLKAAIRWNEKNASALNYLGYMLADRGHRLEEAIGYIRRALEMDPSNGAYLDSLGWAYFKKGDYGRAEEYLGEAVGSLAQEPEIYDHLGDLYHATGRAQEAVEAWGKALRHGAENAAAIRSKIDSESKSPPGKP